MLIRVCAVTLVMQGGGSQVGVTIMCVCVVVQLLSHIQLLEVVEDRDSKRRCHLSHSFNSFLGFLSGISFRMFLKASPAFARSGFGISRTTRSCWVVSLL